MVKPATRAVFQEAYDSGEEAKRFFLTRNTDEIEGHKELYDAYETACNELGIKARNNADFVWLIVAAERTVIPHFALSRVAKPKSLNEDLICLKKIIHMWCFVDIMIDDATEHLDEEASEDCLELIFKTTEEYFRLSSEDSENGIDAETFVNGFLNEEAPDAPDAHKNYILTICQFIETIFKKTKKFGSQKPEKCRSGMLDEYKKLLDACRFSREYSKVLKTGTRQQILDLAPTLYDYVQKTKANMGTRMMLIIAAMILAKDKDINLCLKAAEEFDDSTRLSNDLNSKEEIPPLLANGLLHQAIIDGLDPEELRAQPIEERIAFTRGAIGIALPNVMDQYCILRDMAMLRAKDLDGIYDKDVAVSASAYIGERLLNLLTLEILRASEEFREDLAGILNESEL